MAALRIGEARRPAVEVSYGSAFGAVSWSGQTTRLSATTPTKAA
jgi:hypothetical protein